MINRVTDGGASGHSDTSPVYGPYPCALLVATATVYPTPADSAEAAIAVCIADDVSDCSVAWSAPAASSHRTVDPVVTRARYPVCGNGELCRHDTPMGFVLSNRSPGIGAVTAGAAGTVVGVIS